MVLAHQYSQTSSWWAINWFMGKGNRYQVHSLFMGKQYQTPPSSILYTPSVSYEETDNFEFYIFLKNVIGVKFLN